MASFNTYLPLLQQVEGGFQNNPKDRGNYNSLDQLIGTNYGISTGFYEGILGRPPTVADIKAITKPRAAELYRVYFWNAQRASEINSQAIANTIIDHQVNAGNGVLVAQKLLNSRFGFSLAVDNRMGNNSLAAINSVDVGKFVTLFNEQRAAHYNTRSNSSEFADGWLRRLTKFAVDYQKPISLLAIGAVATVGFIFYKFYLKS